MLTLININYRSTPCSQNIVQVLSLFLKNSSIFPSNNFWIFRPKYLNIWIIFGFWKCPQIKYEYHYLESCPTLSCTGSVLKWIFEYFLPNIDIRIRFVDIFRIQILFEYSNILVWIFRNYLMEKYLNFWDTKTKFGEQGVDL